MSIDSIPVLAMAMARENTLSDVGIAMLRNSLNVNESAGAELTQMIDAAAMERSVNPAVGSNFDVSI